MHTRTYHTRTHTNTHTVAVVVASPHTTFVGMCWCWWWWCPSSIYAYAHTKYVLCAKCLCAQFTGVCNVRVQLQYVYVFSNGTSVPHSNRSTPDWLHTHTHIQRHPFAAFYMTCGAHNIHHGVDTFQTNTKSIHFEKPTECIPTNCTYLCPFNIYSDCLACQRESDTRSLFCWHALCPSGIHTWSTEALFFILTKTKSLCLEIYFAFL